MMRTLLYKQLRLVCHPMTPVFCMFGVMLMIPNYPLTVVWFYVMLGLFFTFLNMREQKDIYYSAILPIRKRDTVKAACLFTALIELASLVIAVPFAVWRAHTSIGGNLVGVDANVTLFGFALMLYALFNAILLCSFYKTAYQVGTAFLKAIIPHPGARVARRIRYRAAAARAGRGRGHLRRRLAAHLPPCRRAV